MTVFLWVVIISGPPHWSESSQQAGLQSFALIPRGVLDDSDDVRVWSPKRAVFLLPLRPKKRVSVGLAPKRTSSQVVEGAFDQQSAPQELSVLT